MPPLAMRTITLPIIWAVALSFLADNDKPRIQALSIFDGTGGMSSAFFEVGWLTSSFEISRDPILQDVLSLQGTQAVLQAIMRMPMDALVWLAPPCGSWGWLSRSKSRRSSASPEGNINDSWVHANNLLADWVALILRLLTSLGIYFVLEQPTDSCLHRYPAIADSLRECGARCTAVQLFNWGASSLKPLTLWGTAPWLSALESSNSRRAAANVGRSRDTLTVVNPDGSRTGRRAELTESGAYPTAFCQEVARLHLDWCQLMHSRA